MLYLAFMLLKILFFDFVISDIKEKKGFVANCNIL